MLTETQNQDIITQLILEFASNSSSPITVIIDGDRTFIPEDSTRYFFEFLNEDYGEVKKIFKAQGYSFAAFHEVAEVYSKIPKARYDAACKFASSQVVIYEPFLQFVKALSGKAQLMLVTAGIAKLWKEVILRNGLAGMEVIGGNYFPQDSYVVDKIAKGNIARTLVQAGKTVFAFGDTLIDLDMLTAAQYPYLVVNERRNHDLVPFANQIKNLGQVVFHHEAHPDIPVVTLPEILQVIDQHHESSFG